MQGIITTRHLVTNAPTIINEFGIAAYMRCLAAALSSRRDVTFLEVVMSMGKPAASMTAEPNPTDARLQHTVVPPVSRTLSLRGIIRGTRRCQERLGVFRRLRRPWLIDCERHDSCSVASRNTACGQTEH